MRKNYFLCFLFALISYVSFGQVILSEDFSYADGSLVGNGAWASFSGTAGDLLVSSGQAVVQHGTPSEDASLSFTSVSGDIFYAFDFSVDDLGSPYSGTDNEYFAVFKDSGFGFSARIDIVPPTAAGDYTVGISSTTSTAQATWATDLTFGTSYRAIVKFDQNTGTAQLWIDATAATDTSISGTADGPETVSQFALRQSDSSVNETVRVDNLMIGQTFDDVDTFVAQTNPTLAISSPSDNSTFSPETTSVDVGISVTNFNVAAGGTGDGYIKYTVNSGTAVDKFDTADISLTSLTPNSYAVTVELVDNSGASLSPAVSATVNFTIASYTQVADLAALRAGTEGNYYEVTGEVVMSYNTGNSRNQKYIQDASAGILIDDSAGTITTAYNVYDGITGLKGRLGSFNDVSQFVPAADPGAATSTGNTITPEVVTLADFEASWDNYESELITIQNVVFTDGGAMFAASQNYEITSGATTSTFRTNFSGADYIGTTIPSTGVDMTVIGGEFRGDPQVTAIELAGLVLGLKDNDIEGFAVYPNPVNAKTFKLTTASFTTKTVQIFNVLGKEVYTTKVNGVNNEIDVATLNSGIYILKVVEEGKMASKKLIIK